MLGLVVAYLWGKDHGHQQAVAVDDSAKASVPVVGCCTVGGAVLTGMNGGDVAAGFFWGMAIGVTLWVVGGAVLTGRGCTIFALSTASGAWTGYFVGGTFDSVWTGFLYGAAVWLGWLLLPLAHRFGAWCAVRRAARRARKQAAAVPTAGIWELTPAEIEDARWLYATDDEYAREVDALAKTDPAAAAELRGGLA